MGKILKGILGGVSGIVGPVVGAVVRGLSTIRSRPKKSTKPAVESQIQQRNKFGMATEFISKITSIIQVGYQSASKTMSANNAAVQDLLSNAIKGVAPNYEIDYPKVKISKGSLAQIHTLSMSTPNSSLDFILTWDPNEIVGDEAEQYAKDRLWLIVYNVTLKTFIIATGIATRSAGRYETLMPAHHAGHPLHVWVFLRSADTKLVSTSQYLGIATVIRP